MHILNQLPVPGTEPANPATEAEIQGLQIEEALDQEGKDNRFSSLFSTSALPTVDAVRQDLPPEMATYAAPVDSALHTVQLQAASSGSDLNLDPVAPELAAPAFAVAPGRSPATAVGALALGAATPQPATFRSAPQVSPTGMEVASSAVAAVREAAPGGETIPASDTTQGLTNSGHPAPDARAVTGPPAGLEAPQTTLERAADFAAPTNVPKPSAAEPMDLGYGDQFASTPVHSGLDGGEALRPDIGQVLMRNGVSAVSAARPDAGSESVQPPNTSNATAGAGMGNAAAPVSGAGPAGAAPASSSPAMSAAALPGLALPLSTDASPVPERQAGAWQQVMGQRLSRMVMQGTHAAQIQLDPPELGKLGVRVSLVGDEASVQFTSQHSAVRDLLESSAPRLREMMAEQGLELVDVGVGTDAGESGQSPFFGQPTSGPEAGNSPDGVTGTSDAADRPGRRLPADDAMVDYYA